jgi:hypothetical protein
VWPAAVVFLLVRYQPTIERLLGGAKIKFTLFHVTIETTLETLQRSVEESFGEQSLSDKQWDWLTKLKDGHRLPYKYKEDNPDLEAYAKPGC